MLTAACTPAPSSMSPEGKATTETATSPRPEMQEMAGAWRYPDGGRISFSDDGKFTSTTHGGFEDNGTCKIVDSSQQENLFVMRSSKLRSEIGVKQVIITPGLVKLTYVDYPPSDGPTTFLGTWPPAHFLVRADSNGEFSEELVQLAGRLQELLERHSQPPIQFISPDADGSNPWLALPPDDSAK